MMKKKKALIAEIEQLKIENKQLQHDNAHWVWVVDRLFRLIVTNPNHYWERVEPFGAPLPEHPFRTDPFLVSYITEKGITMNLLIVKDYRKGDDE